MSLCLFTQCIFFLSDQVSFPARKPRGVSADISEHGASSSKTSQPSSETKHPKPPPNIFIHLPPESHDSAVKTQQQSSGTATHETPALENKSATKTMSGFYTWHPSAKTQLSKQVTTCQAHGQLMYTYTGPVNQNSEHVTGLITFSDKNLS